MIHCPDEGLPPSVGYTDISPSRGEIGRWLFRRKGKG